MGLHGTHISIGIVLLPFFVTPPLFTQTVLGTSSVVVVTCLTVVEVVEVVEVVAASVVEVASDGSAPSARPCHHPPAPARTRATTTTEAIFRMSLSRDVGGTHLTEETRQRSLARIQHFGAVR
jgi:hypothetical protein